MLQLLRAVSDLALPASRCRLKLAVRGGILRVTGGELSVGMGLFGSRDVRRVPLAAITDIHAVEGLAPTAGVTLHIIAGGEELRIVGLSPLSARRLRAILQSVQRSA